MHETGCLIIDDVEASLSMMTELGLQIVGESAEAIRKAVLAFAARRSWVLVPHRAYVQWASETVKHDEYAWLILDPVFPLAALGARARRIRLTRIFHGNDSILSGEYLITGRYEATDLTPVSGNVGVLDDVAASGQTLRRTARLVAQAGGVVAHVVLAASARAARAALPAQFRGARWSAFVRGDWKTLHLRDGCPYMAYSGRPTEQAPMLGVDGVPVEARIMSSDTKGSLWQVVTMDSAVRAAVEAARREIPRRLEQVLGRPARVRDLPLLGRHVPALVGLNETLTADAGL